MLWVKEGEVMQKKFPDGMSVEDVFDKYCNTVYRLAYVRVQNRFDAEDILQPFFLNSAKKRAILVTASILRLGF